VGPTRHEHLDDAAAPTSKVERARQRAVALRQRGERLAERAQEERGRHASVDALFEMVDRDGETGGGIIAGALAYRLFIWLLPLSLVLIAGLGFAAGASSESPKAAARSLGAAGLVSSSVASAAEGSARWYALLVGIPILLWTSRSVLRALIGAHRLVWTDARATAPKPTAAATARFLGLFLGFYLFAGLASVVRAHGPGLGVLATFLLALPYAAIWLLISIRLPHRGADWQALVPGALLIGIGAEVLNILAAYLLTPYALSKQGTYGALGIAAALLLGLYLVCRLVVFGAVVNATLWERRSRTG